MLDFVPFAGSRGQVADSDVQAGFFSELGELDLPGPDAAAVGSAAVGTYEQPASPGVAGLSDGFPPCAQGGHRERRRIMIGADRDPARVPREVIDAVGDRLAQVLIHEIVDVDPLRLPGRPVLASGVLEVSDQFFFLRVHRDHRLACSHMLTDLACQIRELGVAVFVLGAFGDFGIGLQAKAHLVQHPRHRPVRDRMPQIRERGREVTG